MISAARLRELFDYEPETGQLVRKVSGRGVKAGVAGSIRLDKDNPLGRRFISADGRKYRASHLVWVWHGNSLPERLDHIDRNTLNDRIENLRPCDNAQNGWNARLSKANKSGVRGVFWNKATGNWRVRVMVRGRVKELGLHDDLDLAELIANEARKRYHGAFAANYERT